MTRFLSNYPLAVWAQEGGDPCVPTPWSWVQCNSDPQPRITSILLSGKNLTGGIPLELTKLTGLIELWLDGNMLAGPVPDFVGCVTLKIIHLENNNLHGQLPSSLADLPSLAELYVQNNMLSGTIPGGLLHRNIIFNYSENTNLRKERNSTRSMVIVICCVVVFFMLLLALLAYQLFAHKRRNFLSEEDDLVTVLPPQNLCSYNGLVTKTSQQYTLSEIQKATGNFARKVGAGGYGTVYYGKLKDEREIAVKVLRNDSYQGNRQFKNEVSLLSRIHHRNLVMFMGSCQQEGKSILIYEFMHKGTLKEHLHGTSSQERPLSWIKRLEIAEDAAKGIEYLHTGCSPAIIHRDLKTSNILLDEQMSAKVSDFGLSKPALDESHVSSVVRGTLGYLDPEYYTSQQLTAKSDVYSFGIVLLELISSREPISHTSFGEDFRNIGRWAKFHYENGDIEAILGPSLRDGYNDIQSVWKITELAVRCANHEMRNRPSMSEVLKEIQEVIAMERAPINTKLNHSSSTPTVDAFNRDALERSTDFLTQPGLR